MSLSSGIIVGIVVLAVLLLGGGCLAVRVRRRRHREPSWPRLEAAGRNGTSSGRFESEQIHVGERLGSWTRRPADAKAAANPTSAVGATGAPDQRPQSLELSPAPLLSRERLIAPVELWFGSTRVGVVQGSATHEAFEQYASVLLSELPER